MKYLIVFVILFVLELCYFKIANYFNIIDKPNERSSHSTVTLRGGGIVFYFAILLFFIYSGFLYPWFFLGLTLMTAVSLLDDIFTLSNKIRLFIHFISVLLMAFELNIFNLSWGYLLITFVVVVGVINAYNFMDGINGITASYSLAISFLLIVVNNELQFISKDFLIFSTLGVIVFSYFNFRKKARSFAGDVGSVAIAYILLFALGLLIIKTNNMIYFLFLSVYGVDSIWTIVRRLFLKENIFEAHRSHLYQYLGNEAKINKLSISFYYGIIQFFIGLLVIYFSKFSHNIQIIFSIVLLAILSITYLILKNYVIKRFVNINVKRV